MKTSVVLGLAGVFVAFAIVHAQPANQRGEQRTPAAGKAIPDDVQQMLGWLPRDTETVIVCQRPFEVWGSNEVGTDNTMKAILRDVLQNLPLGPTLELHDGLLRETLQGHKVLLAVEGSRGFRMIKRGVAVPYEGCHVMRFTDASDDVLQATIQRCLEKAGKALRIRGMDVAVFSESREKNDWTYFVARPRRGILLCATDQRFLEEVLDRMEKHEEGRALPESLPEWKHIDTTAPVWGIHHYAEKGRDRLQAFRPDRDAVGFVFAFDPDSNFQASYLSAANDLNAVIAKRWKERDGGKFALSKPGLADIKLNAGKLSDDDAEFVMLLVMLYLGHFPVPE